MFSLFCFFLKSNFLFSHRAPTVVLVTSNLQSSGLCKKKMFVVFETMITFPEIFYDSVEITHEVILSMTLQAQHIHAKDDVMQK